METTQSGILAPLPRLARYLEFSLLPDVNPRAAMKRLLDLADGDQIVVGLGLSLTQALDKKIDGLGVSDQERHPLSGHGTAERQPMGLTGHPFHLWDRLGESHRGLAIDDDPEASTFAVPQQKHHAAEEIRVR